LSFHGGLVGGFLAFWIFCRRFGYSFLNVADEISLCVPIGLGLGRIANFINGELYGRATNLPWGMVFPQGGPESRHPSQLYESVLEGPVLFLIVWSVAKRRPPDGTVVAVCILAYGILRFFVEFVREPEPPLGTILGPFTMGQLLCVPMILFGIGLLFHFRRQRGGRKSERLKVSIKPKKGSPSKTSQSSD
jgi:phosphatidylglycerol:prolipoprotein diacylglycerol transferase